MRAMATFAIAKPRPLPVADLWRPRTNLAVTNSSSGSGIPGPSSSMTTRTSFPRSSTWHVTTSFAWSSAFSSRLRSARTKKCGSTLARTSCSELSSFIGIPRADAKGSKSATTELTRWFILSYEWHGRASLASSAAISSSCLTNRLVRSTPAAICRSALA